MPQSDHSAFLSGVDALLPFTRKLVFDNGEILRRQGQHYTDAMILLRGSVAVELAAPKGKRRQTVQLGAGSAIGEIGFLQGLAATATVTAASAGEALLLDDDTLDRLENEVPQLAADLSRFLARTADQRLQANTALDLDPAHFGSGEGISVKLCRSPDMLKKAQQLRYAIYKMELGRDSPFADDRERTISDELDSFCHTFVALNHDEPIGTIRVNFARDGDLGALTSLYNMDKSPNYPGHNGICSKYMVRRDFRGGPLAMKLIAAATAFGLRHDMRECFIDCIPKLLPYYRALGFQQSGEKFLHRENGPSIPLRIDFARYGKKLQRGPSKARMLGLYLRAKALKSADRWMPGNA